MNLPRPFFLLSVCQPGTFGLMSLSQAPWVDSFQRKG